MYNEQVLSPGCISITSIQIFYRVTTGDGEWFVEQVVSPATQQGAVVSVPGQDAIEVKIMFLNNANLAYETGVNFIEGSRNSYSDARKYFLQDILLNALISLYISMIRTRLRDVLKRNSPY